MRLQGVWSVGFLFLGLWTYEAKAEESCVRFDEAKTQIIVACNVHFAEVARKIQPSDALRSLGSGQWLLSAELLVVDGAKLTLDASDASWLKINHRFRTPRPYSVVVRGAILIDGVKITSWDPQTESVVQQDAKGSVPRSAIKILAGEGSVIQNSEIAYLGYNNLDEGAFQALRFQDSKNGLIQNNEFHDNWYAFYSDHASFIKIASNHYHHNIRYAIDPHTHSHDLLILKNHIHHNQGIGAICSENCYNITFDGNEIHDNTKVAIMFSSNTTHSIARNNVIYNQRFGISIGESSDNEVYANQISSTGIGIFVNPVSSTRNKIHDNSIKDAETGILVGSDVGGNEGNLYDNNRFYQVTQLFNLNSGSTVDIAHQHFDHASLIGNHGANRVTISQSGVIEVNGVPFDTNETPYHAGIQDQVLNIHSISNEF